jgi:hypothetical protein
MALLFIDSFDHYGTVVLDKWTSLQTSYSVNTGNETSGIATVGRRGTKGWRASIGAGGYQNDAVYTLYKSLPATGSTCVLGMAFRPVTSFHNNDQGLNVDDVSGGGGATAPCIVAIRYGSTTQFWLKLNEDGTISPMRGAGTGSSVSLGVTTPLQQGVYTHIEVFVTLHATAGIVKIRFNGDEVLNIPVANTRFNADLWNEIRLGSVAPISGAVEWDYDDLYVLDGYGGAPWNNFLGDCRVDASYPTAEGAKSDWIPLPPNTNNALMVDDPGVSDGDGTYVSSTVPGSVDTYIVPDAPVPGAVIYGVQLNLLLRKEDAGNCPLRGVVRHVGLDYPTPAIVNPGTSYAYRTIPIPTNPGTGVQWTEAGFNAAEFGIMRE